MSIKHILLLATIIPVLFCQSLNAQQNSFDKKIPVPGDGEGLKGVHGIAFANEVNKGFISDGKAQAVVVVDLGGGPEFAVSDGKGLIYNNIEDLSSMKVIDTKARTVKATYPLSPCGGPTGIAYDPAHQRIFTGCRTNKGLSVVDVTNGKIVTTLPIGAGVDAIVYDASRQLIFASNGDATTTIIHQESADSYTVLQTLTTQPRAKTMAEDKKTGKIYLSAPAFEPGTRKIIPGTFAVYVYKPA